MRFVAPTVAITRVAALATACSLGAGMTTQAQNRDAPPDFPEPEAEILLVGTFHFKDAGLDGYKPQFDVDVLAPERQKEVAAVVAKLAEYQPTKIAVEAQPERQGVLDERLRAYLAGQFELPSNEIYQLGFRLARQLEHDRVWAVDAPARRYQPVVSPDGWARENGQARLLDPMLELRYEALYRFEDEAKTRRTLGETLLVLNSEERLLRSHGHYLIGAFEVGRPDGDESGQYPGADATTAWYNRNLRIFANLQRLTDAGEERILLIIGAGHVPILRHAIHSSPQYRLVELSDVL